MAFGLKSLAFVDVIQGRRPKSKDQVLTHRLNSS
jgi:hypothetical protein